MGTANLLRCSRRNKFFNQLTPWGRALLEKLSHPARQEIPRLVCNPKVNCLVHKSPSNSEGVTFCNAMVTSYDEELLFPRPTLKVDDQ